MTKALRIVANVAAAGFWAVGAATLAGLVICNMPIRDSSFYTITALVGWCVFVNVLQGRD